MITVGLDFGTHQTKVCVEEKNGVELSYSFFKFADTEGKLQYTLPSIIMIDGQNRLKYGYVPKGKKKKLIRYFKQATFTSINNGQTQNEAIYYSIWYIAFILFDLEEMYGQDFAIQMGVPTDDARLTHQKQLAAVILASAYTLVEDVFENDKEAFLACTLNQLKEKTEVAIYSKELKDNYGMLVFPEAYACLMPLISSSKIANGMSLMVDIGGGTTDISFFTIKKDPKTKQYRPVVYDFNSINMGLNFLTSPDEMDPDRLDSNVQDVSEILKNKRSDFSNNINQVCVALIGKLQREFKKQCNLRMERLMDALKSRPIIYTGGGSTFTILRRGYGGFKDVIHISEKEWRTKSIQELSTIKALGLCPILSTAYGLSISVADDNISCEPFQDIFENIRGAEEEGGHVVNKYKYGKAYGGFSYGDDYDAWK